MNQIIERKSAGAALNGMNRPEDCIERFGIGISIINRQQARFEFAKLLFTFLKERLLNRRHLVHELVPALGGLDGNAPDRFHKLGWIERLHNPSRCARAARALFFGRVAFGCQNENGDRPVRSIASHVFDKTKTVHPRHIDVRDNDIGHGIAQDLEAVQTILGLKHAIARLRESEHQHVAHRAGIVDCENGLAHLGRSGASKAVMGSPSRARFSPKSGDALAIVKGMPSVFQVMAAERSTCRPWPPTWRTHEAWISTGRPRRPRSVAVSCDTALRSRISGNSTACAGPASAWHWPRIRTPPSSRPGSQRRLPAAGCAGLRCGRSLPFAFGVADLLARAGLS